MYKKQRKKVKQLVLKAKNEAWEEFGKSMENNYKSNQKLFFKVIKNTRKNKSSDTMSIKNKQGKVLHDRGEVLERWKEYFEDLLKTNSTATKKGTYSTQNTQNTNEESITMEEVEDALKSIKTGKAPGHDEITPDMLKHLSKEGVNALHYIYTKAWEGKQIPRDWEIGVITPIFKKGDKRDCKNYRGLTLLSTELKTYERIVVNKLNKIISKQLTDTQSGFRNGYCAQDHIFTIQQVIRKRREQQKEVYMAFIDIEKAFDCAQREVIWNSLRNRGINRHLRDAIKSIYRTCTNYVRTHNSRSTTFSTNDGLRQGGVLSPTLFIILMDDVVKKCNEKTKKLHIGYNKLQPSNLSECVFADDIALFASNVENLTRNLEIWHDQLQACGLKINIEKTKVMAVTNTDRKIDIKLKDHSIEQVEHFKYLGVIIDNKGNQEKEINERICKANKTYQAIKNIIMNKREITTKIKVTVYKTILQPIITYGSETWVIPRQYRSKLQAAEMRILRKIKGATIMDKINSQTIREELEVKPLIKHIENKQLGWLGHLSRMDEERQVKRIWDTKVKTKRKKGRPKTTWEQEIGRILKERGTEWQSIKTLAQNKKAWKKFCKQ